MVIEWDYRNESDMEDLQATLVLSKLDFKELPGPATLLRYDRKEQFTRLFFRMQECRQKNFGILLLS
jgi:hypothetical protein